MSFSLWTFLQTHAPLHAFSILCACGEGRTNLQALMTVSATLHGGGGGATAAAVAADDDAAADDDILPPLFREARARVHTNRTSTSFIKPGGTLFFVVRRHQLLP